MRQAVVDASSDVATPPAVWFRGRAALLASLLLIVGGIVVVGSQIWSPAGTTLQAAVRFEVRLAEDQPTDGLREVRLAGSNRVIYLHQETIVTNDDIAHSSLVQGDGPTRFGVAVRFNAAGTQKMLAATTSHVGGLMAILIDGEVVAVPILRGPIGASAVISGDFTKAEAERIVNGISIR